MKNLARHIYRRIRAQFLQRLIPKSTASLPTSADDLCIEVIGFFHSISGIGESARLCAQQLAADGFRVKCTSVEPFFRKPQQQAWYWPNNTFEKSGAKVNCRVFHLNPPMLPPVILQLGLHEFTTTYNIGYWAWELETIPDEWISALRYMNAVMTPSRFTTQAIQPHADFPVLTVTHPVTLVEANSGIKVRLNIPAEAFMVSSIFSFGSALERKNPQALIAAFKLALAQKPDAYLVLKSNTGGDSPEKHALLKSIADHPRIFLLDQEWSRADVLGLIKESDLYASLHRSEGFGLTLAEAMLLGTPVLTTAWSGNMDFCTPENSFLIPATQVNVQADHPEFRELSHASWADADVPLAAQQLRSLYLDRRLLDTKRGCCAQQMRNVIQRHKYQHALHRLLVSETESS